MEQRKEVKRAMAVRVPKEVILPYFYPESFRYYWKGNIEREADMDFNTVFLDGQESLSNTGLRKIK